MSEYFQVDVVARSFRELVLRVEVIDGNPNAFHIERNCALLMALDAEPRDNAFTRDLANQSSLECAGSPSVSPDQLAPRRELNRDRLGAVY